MDKKNLIIIALLLIIVALCGYVFAWVLPDNDRRVNDLKTKLNTLEREVGNARKLVDETAEGLARNRIELAAIREGLGAVRAGLGESRNAITEVRAELNSSLGIIEEIREINNGTQGIYQAIEERK